MARMGFGTMHGRCSCTVGCVKRTIIINQAGVLW